MPHFGASTDRQPLYFLPIFGATFILAGRQLRKVVQGRNSRGNVGNVRTKGHARLRELSLSRSLTFSRTLSLTRKRFYLSLSPREASKIIEPVFT